MHGFTKTSMMRSLLALTALAASTAAAPVAKASIPKPSLTYLFEVQIGLRQPLNPVQLELGGLQDIEPFANGTITGPALNATVSGGLAWPVANVANTVHDPTFVTYGTVIGNSSESFLVQGSGVGTGVEQWIHMDVAIGGQYAYLQDIFILCDLAPNTTTNIVDVNCWCVECTAAQKKLIHG